MTAVQIELNEFLRWLEPPALDADEIEDLSETDVERLLRARYRAFLRRGLDWRQALLLAVTPGA